MTSSFFRRAWALTARLRRFYDVGDGGADFAETFPSGVDVPTPAVSFPCPSVPVLSPLCVYTDGSAILE